MRIYGALMWSMGKVMRCPEVLRVYIGSFWNEPLRFTENAELFEMERADLMRDLRDLPRNSAVRKINELVKRIRTAKVHAYIIGSLKDQMPLMMGHAKKQTQLTQELPAQFRSLVKKYNLAPGDFPDIAEYQGKLKEMEFSKFSVLKQKLIDDAENVLSQDIPRLMEALPRDMGDGMTSDNPDAPLSFPGGNTGSSSAEYAVTGTPAAYAEAVEANPWAEEEVAVTKSPFDDDEEEDTWALRPYVATYKDQFDRVQQGGFCSGAAAKQVLQASGLPVAALRQIWGLADADKDGQLSLNEFVVALYLADQVKDGQAVPAALDPSMVPPK